MIRIPKIQKGFALVTSLLLLLIMTVMGIAMVGRSNLNTNLSVEYDRSERVFFAAEAGIEHARRYLEYKASNNLHPANSLGPIISPPSNRCLADYKDGIGSATSQYDTLGIDNGSYAYMFPTSITGTTMNTSDNCSNINGDPSLEVNYRRMDCEINATDNDVINIFKSYGFSYFIFYEGETGSAISAASVGSGAVGTSTDYTSQTQEITYFYKIVSCGAGFDWNGTSTQATLNEIETIEARVKLEN